MSSEVGFQIMIVFDTSPDMTKGNAGSVAIADTRFSPWLLNV